MLELLLATKLLMTAPRVPKPSLPPGDVALRPLGFRVPQHLSCGKYFFKKGARIYFSPKEPLEKGVKKSKDMLLLGAYTRDIVPVVVDPSQAVSTVGLVPKRFGSFTWTLVVIRANAATLAKAPCLPAPTGTDPRYI